jgi:hypothetical protein
MKVKRAMKKITPIYPIHNAEINVLICKEENEYIAHAIEFDIVAYGDTPEKAERELFDLVRMQITFAIQKNSIDNLFKPAPPEVLQKYIKAKQECLKVALFKVEEIKDLPIITQLKLPPTLLTSPDEEFDLVNA